ncbi:MAG TPA: polysaccharide deacetylase family protein [Polyangiaceae bacterium]|nr:polysaccharide deacetylase family protein [Polyangiaceae bacterium]
MRLGPWIAYFLFGLALGCDASSSTPSAGSGGATSASGGSVSGGSATAGETSGAGMGGSAVTGGSGATGGMATGGMTTSAGGGSGGSSGASVSSLSGIPIPPVEGNVPPPTGAASTLKIVDWAGFKGAVSYTFDDTNSSQISNFDALNGLGVRLTFYLQTNKTTELANDVWKKALAAGHELGNHSHSHQQAPAEAAGAADVDQAQGILKEKFGVTAYTMAAPYGSAVYSTIAKTRFLINRGVSNGLVGPNDASDPFNLYCYIPPGTATAADLNLQIDQARAAGKWRIVLVHGFIGGTDGAYEAVNVTEFTTSVEHSKSLKDMWIDSLVNVGSYWLAQRVITAVTPTTSGSDKTWTWQMPEHFPPGKYLRVTTDGGTLKQGGVALPWDSHGYYEVALDAGAVTLSP